MSSKASGKGSADAGSAKQMRADREELPGQLTFGFDPSASPVIKAATKPKAKRKTPAAEIIDDELPSSLAPPAAKAAEIDALTATLIEADKKNANRLSGSALGVGDDAHDPLDGDLSEAITITRTTRPPIIPRCDTVGQRAFDLESRSIVGRAYTAWERLRADREMPSPVDLDQIDDPDLWSRFFVLDLSPSRIGISHGGSARSGLMNSAVALPALTDYRRTADLLFLGEGLHNLPDARRRQGRLPDLAPCIARIVTGLMDAVIAVRHPLSRSDRYVPRSGPDIYLRLMLLPLSEDNRSVTQILGIVCHSSTAAALPRPMPEPRAAKQVPELVM